jgi:hypothetical protein
MPFLELTFIAVFFACTLEENDDMRKQVLGLFVSILLAGSVSADDQTSGAPVAATAEPDGTLVLSGGSVAVGVGYVWGHGTLTYQGQAHQFRISGLSLADVGVANISATGIVYNLKTLEDLNGNYVAVTAGITIAGGGSAAYLKNEHGVVLKMLATTVGLRFNLAGEGVKVKLKT